MVRLARVSSLPDLPDFRVTSNDIRDGERLPSAQLSRYFSINGGEDVSPDLYWAGAPAHTKSFAVTMCGLDEPTGSGFWHWAVINIPGRVNSLARNAGRQNSSDLPRGATQLPNDIRASCYIGGAPDASGKDFRYAFVVHALDINKIDVPDYATPAYFLLQAKNHIVARGAITAVSSTSGPGANSLNLTWP